MSVQEIIAGIKTALATTSITEWLIFIFAMAYVVLAAIENVWCWLCGIISSILAVYLCFSGHLFLESALNIFYVFIGFYGWYEWLHGSKENKQLPITNRSFRTNLSLIMLGLVIWLPLGFFAHNYSTQVLPYLDAFITAFSIIAT